MDQKMLFLTDCVRELIPIAESCRRYGISRKTGYKWIERFKEHGSQGLLDRSRRPHHLVRSTPQEIIERILEARHHHPNWGAKKLLWLLAKQFPGMSLPPRSTVCDILKRYGLVPPIRKRRRLDHPGRPMTPMIAPNEIWTADYKGHFKTVDGLYCYPLTVADGFSRYLFDVRAFLSPAHEFTQPVFERLFQEYGLPKMIRTDNGAPFATTAIGRLSRLSVWWVRLGIFPELIEPAHPEQNGRHERMHRTLKAETVRPPAADKQKQQDRFDDFRQRYNHERPHESLGQQTPASVYQPSGTPSGSASAMFWVRNTSGSRRSTTGSGRSSSGPSVSGALTNEIQRSRTTAVENTGKMCYLCLRTKMSPISPVVHYVINHKHIFI